MTVYQQSDIEPILSAHANASAQLVTTPCRLRAIYAVPGASAGTLTFKDGGASGTTRCIIDTPASATAAPVQITLPGAGIAFGTDLYCAVSNAGFVTAFYNGQ